MSKRRTEKQKLQRTIETILCEEREERERIEYEEYMEYMQYMLERERQRGWKASNMNWCHDF